MDAELDSLLSTASAVATKVKVNSPDPEPNSPSASPSPLPQKEQQSKPAEKDAKTSSSSSSSKKDHDRESRKRSSSRHRSKSHHHHSRHRSHRHHHHHHRRSRSRSRSSRSSRSSSRSPSPKRVHEQKRTSGNEGLSGTRRGITTAAGEKREKEKTEDGSKRIVFAYSIPVNATMDELYKFFGRAGRVRDIRLISDRHTKRSKGMGYIEYESEVSVSKALALSGQTLLSLPVIITIPFTNNRRPQQQQGSGADPAGAPGSGSGSIDTPASIYVGNLSPNITVEDVRSIFGVFGEITDVSMPVNILTKKPCGYAFVRYKDSTAAGTVITQANLMEVAGYPMRLGYVLDSQVAKAIDSGNQSMAQMQQMQQAQLYPYKTANGMLGELDNDEGTGLTINSSSRIMLMKSLQGDDIPGQAPPTYNMMAALGNTGSQQQPQSAAVAAAAAASTQIRSRCVILRDMFNPKEETDPNFDVEIKNDVFSEATRFGEITHIFVDKRSLGLVYIKFTSEESAKAVVAQFNGRWFGGRQITAELSPEDYYNSKFSLN